MIDERYTVDECECCKYYGTEECAFCMYGGLCLNFESKEDEDGEDR